MQDKSEILKWRPVLKLWLNRGIRSCSKYKLEPHVNLIEITQVRMKEFSLSFSLYHWRARPEM